MHSSLFHGDDPKRIQARIAHVVFFYSYAREFMRMFTRAAHIIACLAPTHECTSERVLYIANSAHTFSVATAVCCCLLPLCHSPEKHAHESNARARSKLQRSQNNVSHKHNTTPYSARATKTRRAKKNSMLHARGLVYVHKQRYGFRVSGCRRRPHSHSAGTLVTRPEDSEGRQNDACCQMYSVG